MVAPALIPLALGVAEFAAPRLARWLGGEEAGRVAGQILDSAKAVTGQGDPALALEKLRADTALAAEFGRRALLLENRLLEEETQRLTIVNRTMQAEIASGDGYVRRWRPTFGYAVALAWSATFLALAYAVIFAPAEAPAIIAALVNTSPLWGVALTVLGVSIASRSKDKALAAGQPPKGGLLDGVAKLLRGGS